MNKQKITILSVLLCVLLAGCSAKTEIPDLSSMGDVAVISREDGSGTRDEFERLVNADGKGTKEIAASTEKVLEKVSDDRNAIGYVAYSSIPSEMDLRVIAVDGIQISEKTIKKGQYALCRNYYLAYSGELNAVEKDFLSYVLSAGQNIVEKNCIAVKKSGTFLSDRSSGEIIINGSSSMVSIIQALVEDYKAYNPNAEITLQITDSTTGLTTAMRGECGFAMSSRELKEYEEELLTKKAIGTDAVAVIVNMENPIDNFSKKQLRELYDGNYKRWSDIK